MADSELSALTEDTAPAVDDWFYKVNNAGSVDRKVKFQNIGGKVLIERQVGARTSFDFQNIPQGFHALEVQAVLRTDVAATVDSMYVAFNNDTTAANYDGSFSGGANVTSTTTPTLGAANAFARFVGYATGATATANHFNELDFRIMNPASTSHFKVASGQMRHWSSRAAASIGEYMTLVGWASTAAITRIAIIPATGPNIIAGSAACLYGWA